MGTYSTYFAPPEGAQPGRPISIDMRAAVNAMLYVARTGSISPVRVQAMLGGYLPEPSPNNLTNIYQGRCRCRENFAMTVGVGKFRH